MCVGDTASVPAAHEALSIVMCLMVHPSLFTVYIASFDQIHCLLRQRAQEEVHSKELKVKLLTDSVNSFIAKAPPTAHDALRSELDVLKVNYQRLCSRLDGKCKTLEVIFFFPFNSLKQKLRADMAVCQSKVPPGKKKKTYSLVGLKSTFATFLC